MEVAHWIRDIDGRLDELIHQDFELAEVEKESAQLQDVVLSLYF